LEAKCNSYRSVFALVGDFQRAIEIGWPMLTEWFNEEFLRSAVSLLVRLTETAAATVIFSGAIVGFVMFLVRLVRFRHTKNFAVIRLNLGRYLALGLEFQLASDLLRTAVSPTFEEIGKLAAVAAIRTALNYFLSLEIQKERKETTDVELA
jgi:uncharacterized membrane protein